MAFVEFHNVKKTYHTGEISIDALRDVNFQVEKGELCSSTGRLRSPVRRPASNILGGMDTVYSDGYCFAGWTGRILRPTMNAQLTGYQP